MGRRSDLLDDLRHRLNAGQGFAVATLNLDHVVKLRRLPRFLDAYRTQTHVVADGKPVVWLLRLAGEPVDLVPGSDLTVPLAGLAAAEGIPLALLGSTPESLRIAAERLVRRFPALDIAACISPPFGFDPDGPAAETCFATLEASGARLCLLALGAPKQEIFAARGRARLPGMGFVSVGAGIDFLSGVQRRAPPLLRALALEWAWRLATDPRRLARRYKDCFAILPTLTAEALAIRRNRDREV